MRIALLKQFSVFLPNRPGALSALTKLLAEGGVNIVGIASEVRDDSGVVRIAVGPEVDASGILSQAGLASVETTLISLEVADKPGELQRLVAALAEGRINITTVYGTSTPSAGTARILIAAENVDKAKAVLEKVAAA